MSTALTKAARLKPEIRLGQAVSEFQVNLSSLEKATFRSQQTNACKNPPDIRDVMQLTAELNRCTGAHGQCFGPRVTSILRAVQQFASLGDIVVGGSQNLLACGVWSVVRLTLVAVVKHSTYFERLSSMLMAAGRSAPRYQAMAIVYPKSEALRSYMMEYFIVIVRLCQHVMKSGQKSGLRHWVETMSDSSYDGYQSELELWASSIKEEVNVLMARQVAAEAKANAWFRSHVTRRHESRAPAKRLKTRKETLDACSTYDHETSWKRLRKLRNSTLGSGKSVLLANVVDDLHWDADPGATVAYFFCQPDAVESTKAATVIGSLARQLLHPVANLDAACEFLLGSRCTDTKHLLDLLRQTLPSTYLAYFVLDGLDICHVDEQFLILDILRSLQLNTFLMLCISFRLEPSESRISSFDRFSGVTLFTMPENNPDIGAFINSELQRCLEKGSLGINDPLLILEIQESLRKGAQGMFLWVAMQIKALCLERTDADIRQAIQALPRDLSEVYSIILRKSRGGDASYQMRIFELVAAACRPLTPEEMREALSINPGDKIWSPRHLVNDIYSTLACCGGLLIVDEEDLGIRMVHHSVIAFLLRRFEQFDLQRAKRGIAEIIVTCVNYEAFSKEITPLRAPIIHGNSISSAVVSSAAYSLGQSQRLALKLLRLGPQADKDIGPALLNSIGHHKTKAPLSFYQYSSSWWPDHIWDLDYKNPVMARFLSDTLATVDPNRTDSHGRTLLSLAAERGYEDIVLLLLSHGARDSPNSAGQTLLMQAVEAGRISLVAALLNSKNVQIDAPDLMGRTCLSLAMIAKNHTIIELLLKYPQINADHQDINGRTPLIWAVFSNFLRGVELLMMLPNFNATTPDKSLDTPLHAAACYGYIKILQYLVNRTRPDLNSQNSRQQTPIWVAAANGHEDIVSYLASIDSVNLNSRSIDGQSPLLVATINGHERVVEILIRCNRVDDSVEDDEGCKALSIAAKNGHVELVKILANSGRMLLNHRNQRGESPLWLAAAEGHHTVVEAMVSFEGVDRHCQDALGLTPFWIAASFGHWRVVELLGKLETQNPNVPNRAGITPLSIAASRGHEAVMASIARLKTVPLNADELNTTLWSAAHRGNAGVVQVLAAFEMVDVNFVNDEDESRRTPLLAAIDGHHKVTVQALLDSDRVDLSRADHKGCTPLDMARNLGFEDIAAILSEKNT
ncbi:ankyrin repeat-containing domain protein [Aspergillus cavernicola]|uniref:Ankyrin repeat-containing domain protein n=1 Tax=Aspergillus cavernicola TaxID=176166 RepID=A0ABR4I379_9EURO